MCLFHHSLRPYSGQEDREGQVYGGKLAQERIFKAVGSMHIDVPARVEIDAGLEPSDDVQIACGIEGSAVAAVLVFGFPPR